MATPTSEVINRLAGFGVKIGDFVQGVEGGRLAPGQVDEGYCNGVCTDWARRVLQGGRSSFTDKEERKTGQARRQAHVQVESETMRDQFNAVNSLRNSIVDAYNQSLNFTHVIIPQQMQTKLQDYFEFVPDPERKYPLARLSSWMRGLQEIGQTYDRRTEVGFAEFVRRVDAAHVRYRREEDRGPSSRPFNHIRCVASSDRVPYPSIHAATNTLLQLDAFVVDTVLILGFGLVAGGGNTGHAVALHRVDDTTYRFIDPNYGVFEYTGLVGCASALRYLFGTAYGVPIYGEDGDRVTGAVSYTLFSQVA